MHWDQLQPIISSIIHRYECSKQSRDFSAALYLKMLNVTLVELGHYMLEHLETCVVSKKLKRESGLFWS